MRTLHRTMTMNNQATTRNVLIFEYVTGGGFSIENVPKSLANEGKMMVDTLLENFAALPFNVSVMKKDDALTLDDNFKTQLQAVDAVGLWRGEPCAGVLRAVVGVVAGG